MHHPSILFPTPTHPKAPTVALVFMLIQHMVRAGTEDIAFPFLHLPLLQIVLRSARFAHLLLRRLAANRLRGSRQSITEEEEFDSSSDIHGELILSLLFILAHLVSLVAAAHQSLACLRRNLRSNLTECLPFLLLVIPSQTILVATSRKVTVKK